MKLQSINIVYSDIFSGPKHKKSPWKTEVILFESSTIFVKSKIIYMNI